MLAGHLNGKRKSSVKQRAEETVGADVEGKVEKGPSDNGSIRSYNPELQQIPGTTSRRQSSMWKSAVLGCEGDFAYICVS